MKWISVKERLPATNLIKKTLEDGRIITESDKSQPILFIIKDETEENKILQLTGWFDNRYKKDKDWDPWTTYSCGCCFKRSYRLNEITHWAELPEPPKDTE